MVASKIWYENQLKLIFSTQKNVFTWHLLGSAFADRYFQPISLNHFGWQDDD